MLDRDLRLTAEAPRLVYDVVIPCYNRAGTVEQAVDSVLMQDPAPEQVILVDDGSTDTTANRLLDLERRHPTVTAVLMPRNGGASAARNAGLALAKAPWIAFLDSDDAWLPGAAQALLAAAPNNDVVVGQFRRAWPDGEHGPPECGWDGEDVVTALALTGAIGPSWSIVRRSLAVKIGGFDPTFHNCNDWDFYVRIAAAGGRFTRIEATIAFYHVAAANRLSNDDQAGQSNARRVQAHPLLQQLLVRVGEMPEAGFSA